jgi:alkyl sulfatase BDS1-like metallo-beta-lactamase superfamily hydrolase
MNLRKAKRIRRHANKLVFEWLKTMLTDEEAKKLNPKNMAEYMPEQTHLFANRSLRLSAYTPRWFQQRIKRIIRKNKKTIENITLQEIENA